MVSPQKHFPRPLAKLAAGREGERLAGQIYVPFSAIIKFYITELITVMTFTPPESAGGVRFGTSSGAEFRAFCGENDGLCRVT